MSVNKRPLKPVPSAVAAWAKKQKKNPVIAISDVLDATLDWDDFSELYSTLGQPGVHPRVLAVVTLLQHANGLSDRQAIECLETRLDWKYAARMDIDEPAFDHTVLSEFRERLVAHGLEDVLLNKILHAAEEANFLKKAKQRTDSTHVLANVRELGRIERVQEAFRCALNISITSFYTELMTFCQTEWAIRYDRVPYNFKAPKAGKQRDQLVQQLGEDISAFLLGASRFEKLVGTDEVQGLQLIFEQQMILTGGVWRLRDDSESMNNRDRVASPHDTDARFGRKGSRGWLGYKVHFTETCEGGGPRLITNVMTVPACIDDSDVLTQIHGSLKLRGLAPEEHLVDGGYTEVAAMFASEQNLGIRVIGPVKPDPGWQAKQDSGFALKDFAIDFDAKRAQCPAGKTSVTWAQNATEQTVLIGFDRRECRKCPFAADCTTSNRGRRLTVKSANLFEYLRSRREEQETAEFKAAYKMRSGVEGTHSQAVRKAGFRRSSYSGLAKTGLQGWLVAAGLNLYRIADWMRTKAVAPTRTSLVDKLAIA